MRKMLAAFLSLSIMLLPSCKSKKEVAGPYPAYNQGQVVTKVKDSEDECETASKEASGSEIRTYGSSVDPDADFARHQALLNAKGELVGLMQSLVTNVHNNYRSTMKSNQKRVSEGDNSQEIRTMSEKMVENCKIVCSNRYRLSDGTYECTVCISVPSRSAELVAGAASLSEDERIGIKFREEQFRESFKEELERFRQMQSGK